MAPNHSAPQLNWHELFDQHFFVLKEHLALLKQLKSQLPKTSDKRSATTDCIDRTKDLIKNFQEITISLKTSELEGKIAAPTNTNGLNAMPNTTEGPKLGSKKARKLAELTPKIQNPFSVNLPGSTDFVAPVTDASGLFAIDTNPTPVDQLKPRKEKRQTSEQQEDQGDAVEAPAKKRHKSDKQPPEQAENDDRRDSFEQRVEERLQMQEEKREQKAKKKRKRESNGSVDNSDLAKYLEPTPNPKKRRINDMKAQLHQAQSLNPEITFKDIKKLNLRKNWRRLQSQGITNLAEAHEAQKKHDAKKEVENEKIRETRARKKEKRIKKRLKKRAALESGDKDNTRF